MNNMIGSTKEVLKDLLVRQRMYYILKDKTFYENSVNQIQYKFYEEIIQPKKLVFDIGGNVGQRAKIYSDLVDQVVVFEPQPYCIRHLKSRFHNNKKIIVEEIALSDENGNAPMFISSSHVLSTLSKSFIRTAGKTVFKQENWDNEVIVKTQTIDEMINKYGDPDFIKIDVEGYEIAVLKGLSFPVKHLSFEFMPNLFEDAKKCLDYLKFLSNDYVFNYTLGEELKYRLDKHLPYKEFLEIDEIKTAKSFGDIYAKLK